MSDNNKRLIKKIQIIIYTLIGVLIICAVVLDAYNYISLSSEFAFIIIGFILFLIGIFGFLNNELQIGNANSLEYNKISIVGKIANIVIVILGITSLVIGIYALLSA